MTKIFNMVVCLDCGKETARSYIYVPYGTLVGVYCSECYNKRFPVDSLKEGIKDCENSFS